MDVPSALADLESRRSRLASYWNKSYFEAEASSRGAGLGSFEKDNSTRSMRRIAAGLLSLDRTGIEPRQPTAFPTTVENWTKSVSRFESEGTAGLFGDGDYDMDEREIVTLLYAFKDKPALLTNEAAFNLVSKGMYFWHGSETTHAMQFEVGPVNWYSETENHVLMILSAQYLTNQWIYKNYRNDARWRNLATIQGLLPRISGPNGTTLPIANISSLEFFKSSTALEDTILAAVGRIPHAGFFETNGRNYQAITLQTLLNLYAFADSAKIRTAAKNALDYAAAKFAFQSIDCKRFSPHRRHYEYTERPGIWENDSTMFLWGALSGACSFPDGSSSSSISTDTDTNFFNYNSQGRGFAFWALLLADERLLGARRYRIPEAIHDFMLNKHNGFWARFQDRFTQNHYRLWFNPRYFYDDGRPYLSGTFVPAPEFNFVTNSFMNVAGGNHAEYDLKGGTLNGRIYDFWARPSAVIPAGHYKITNKAPGDTNTGDWGSDEGPTISVTIPDGRGGTRTVQVATPGPGRSLLNRDILNMSSRGDEWWYGKNLGVYKNFTIGSDPAQVPQDPRHPLYAENGKTEFTNEFQTLSFRFQQVFVAGASTSESYYLVLGKLLADPRYYFWEVVPSYRFPSLSSLKATVLARNYGSGESTPQGFTLVLSNGDAITVSPGEDYPIKRVVSQGKDVPLGRFWYDPAFPAANPLMEVFEVDRNFNFTGVRYAETPTSGRIQIWNPFLNKLLIIDSSDYKNPKSEERSTPLPSARQDLTDEITPATGSWGTWYGPTYCPAGQFAVSYRMRVEGNQGSGDDTSLNAVQLECRPVDGSSSTWISPHDGYWGNWTPAATCPRSSSSSVDNFLSGARLLVEPPQGSGDDTGANDATFSCTSGSTINPGGGRAIGTWSNYAKCPTDSAVCGISSRIEGPQGSDDDTAMNGLRLSCCRKPTPAVTCASPINEPWTDSLGSEGSGWAGIFGDAVVDTANRRLRLSFDDVVERRAALSGSYYVSHQLTLSGGTVFTPFPYLDGALLPSIRRSGADMQFGGDRYGGAFWSDVEPAGFAGKRASGVLTGKVTTYVKAQAKQLAMKVEAGGAIYRSGWTAPFTWPQTNLSSFRFVGENNSNVYSGADDFVYVGPVTGCAALTDANIETLYNQ